MGNILQSQCIAENGLCMCLRGSETLDPAGEFVEFQETSTPPPSDAAAAAPSGEPTAEQSRPVKPTSKNKRKPVVPSVQSKGIGENRSVASASTVRPLSSSSVCAKDSSPSSSSDLKERESAIKDTVEASIRGNEENGANLQSDFVWLADSLTLPVDENIAQKIQRQPFAIQKQLLDSLFGRWKGQGKGLSFDELAAPRNFLGTSTSCKSANAAEEALFQAMDDEGVLSSEAFVAVVESNNLNRKGAVTLFKGLQPTETLQGLCLELPDIRMGLRQLAETEMRGSWIGESQLECLLDNLCRNSSFHLSLEDFLQLADSLAATVRCLSLLYSQYEDANEPFSKKDSLRDGLVDSAISPDTPNIPNETKPRARRPSLFRGRKT